MRNGSILSLLGAVLFSTKAIFVKLAYRYDIDSVSLLMLRMLFSLPIFVGIAIWALNQRKEGVSLVLASKWEILIYGLLGYYIASLLDLEGLQYIDASLERVIIFIYPTLVVVLSMIFLRKRITKLQGVAILTTYVGVVIAMAGHLQIESSDNLIYGVLLISGSAFIYAIYLIGSGEVAPRMGTKIYNSVAMIVACLAILMHNMIVHGFNLMSFEWQVYIYALLISSIGTVIPSYLMVEGVRLIGASKSSIIGTIGPISTIVLAAIVLEERITLVQWIGSLIVVGSVLIVMLTKDRMMSIEPDSKRDKE